ncbi:MAG: hypothetical protein WDZ83_10760 [Rhizobiaceae bacterium]
MPSALAQQQGDAAGPAEVWWQGWLTIVTPAASVVIAIIALVFTVKSNRRSERIAKSQTRAYLEFGAPLIPPTDSLREDFKFTLSAVNRGNTPALNVNISAQTFVGEFPLPATHELPNNWEEVGSGIVVHPSGDGEPATFPASGPRMIQADIDTVTSAGSGRRLYAVVKATYNDVFGDSILEVYCISASFGDSPRAELATKHNTYEVTKPS